MVTRKSFQLSNSTKKSLIQRKKIQKMKLKYRQKIHIKKNVNMKPGLILFSKSRFIQ